MKGKLLFYGFILNIPMIWKIIMIGIKDNKIYIKTHINDYTCCGYWMEAHDVLRSYSYGKDAMEIYKKFIGKYNER